MSFEYKTVGAPEKGIRRRGARTKSDRVAAAVEDILKAEAVDGWEYMRTDLVPVIEKSSLFGRLHEVHRAVMVFRRPLKQAGATEAASDEPRRRDPFTPAPSRQSVLEPSVRADPNLRLEDEVQAPTGGRARE